MKLKNPALTISLDTLGTPFSVCYASNNENYGKLFPVAQRFPREKLDSASNHYSSVEVATFVKGCHQLDDQGHRMRHWPLNLMEILESYHGKCTLQFGVFQRSEIANAREDSTVSAALLPLPL